MPPGPGARVRALARRVKVAAEYERVAHARRAGIDDNLVMYESFAGNGMLCNPEAIFRELLAAPDLQHLRHVWALSELEKYAETVAEFAGHPRVKFVAHQSHGYYTALATAKYLVNNATFPPQFGKRKGQVYVNTWHGTPLKAMGYDVPNGAYDTRNVVRNLVAADYLLAPNEDTAQMYLSGYRMTNIYRGKIISEGTPRIDKQFADDARRQAIRARLRDGGVVVDDSQQIILYAPTWRGSFYSPVNDIRQLRARVEAVAAQIDRTKYRLLLKVHQQVYKHASSDAELREMLVPNAVPTNDVLAATDVLVTDYSSIFIDFLASGRPVLFLAPDLVEYSASRGLYLKPDEWPGPVCADVHDLAAEIGRLDTGADDDPAIAYAGAYEAARKRYCPREDGAAAARVVDIVFRGKTDGYQIRSDFSDGRTSVLIHLGGMLPNGITSSALSLLDNIDHDRFDVSVAFPSTKLPQRLQLIQLINPRVRVFPRLGGINGSKLSVKPLLRVKRQSARGHRRVLARRRRLLQDEWLRCFGDSRFDHVVDFSGYSPFWVKMLASRPSGSFSIWLHNDMRAEIDNSGRSEWLRQSVKGVMALYGEADHLVSVSNALGDVNREHLSDRAPAERFTFARNTINYERINRMAYGAKGMLPGGHALGGGDDLGSDPATRDLPDRVDQLMDQFGIETVLAEAERRATLHTVLPPAPGFRTFVTVGRLSPEKNHGRLVRAFDLVHQEDPHTRLVVLGAGPLQLRLAQMIEERGLASAVTLAGHQPNPYVVMSNADCFVLSSDYEGQPMVLLEALILGLPVVTTAFGSVHGALPDGTGLVVERKDKALAGGMRAFLRGEVPGEPFDYVGYNRDATLEFYRAIGAA